MNNSIYTDKFPSIIERRLNKYAYSFVGKGWMKIIFDLDKKLGLLHPRYEISQIKQKFAQLKFYVNFIDDSNYKYILNAEKKASKTCESCASSGKARIINDYQLILCDQHFTELKNDKSVYDEYYQLIS